MAYKALILMLILINGSGVVLAATLVPNMNFSNYSTEPSVPPFTSENALLSNVPSSDQLSGVIGQFNGVIDQVSGILSNGQSSNSNPSSGTTVEQTPTQRDTFQSNNNFVSKTIASIVRSAGSKSLQVIIPIIKSPVTTTPVTTTPVTPPVVTPPVVTPPVVTPPVVTPPVVTPPVVTPPANNSTA
jgi:hypothetical protein